MYFEMQPGRTTESTTSSPLCTRTVSGKRLSARLPSSVQVAQAAAPRTRRVPASACRNMLFVRCVSAPGPDRSAAAQLFSWLSNPPHLPQRLREHAACQVRQRPGPRPLCNSTGARPGNPSHSPRQLIKSSARIAEKL